MKHKQSNSDRQAPSRKLNPYEERNAMLRGMGFDDYKSYLNSPMWAGIRARVFENCPDCVKCGRDARQIHHLRYTAKNLSGESLSGLVAICAGCHVKAEFDGERKVSLAEANCRLLGQEPRRDVELQRIIKENKAANKRARSRKQNKKAKAKKGKKKECCRCSDAGCRRRATGDSGLCKYHTKQLARSRKLEAEAEKQKVPCNGCGTMLKDSKYCRPCLRNMRAKYMEGRSFYQL